jgi:hypothetical protein
MMRAMVVYLREWRTPYYPPAVLYIAARIAGEPSSQAAFLVHVWGCEPGVGGIDSEDGCHGGMTCDHHQICHSASLVLSLLDASSRVLADITSYRLYCGTLRPLPSLHDSHQTRDSKSMERADERKTLDDHGSCAKDSRAGDT